MSGGPKMSVKEITLPNYSLPMELWNSISHGLGAIFALVFGPLMIQKAALLHSPLAMAAVCFYLISMVVTYAGSSVYHALAKNDGKRVMRVIDHDNVFFLIMGCYTPYCLIGLTKSADPFPWSWVILGLVWGLCILGIVLNSVNIHKYKVLSMIVYVSMGSAIVAALYPLWFCIGPGGVLTLLASGVLYWIGAVLYGIGGKKNLWFHTVFHFFILAASVMMFFSIYYFVIC